MTSITRARWQARSRTSRSISSIELPREHAVKIWPEYFTAVKNGTKTFEYRLNDKQYQVGDVMRLMEWDPKSKAFTGEEITRQITFVLQGSGVLEGYCILAVQLMQSAGLSNAQALDFIQKWEDDAAGDLNIANIKRLCAILKGRPEGGYIPGKGIDGTKALPVEPASVAGNSVTITWHPYPAERPEEGSDYIIVKTREGLIAGDIFYQAEHAAHDHSIWQRAAAWIYLRELGNGLEGYDR